MTISSGSTRPPSPLLSTASPQNARISTTYRIRIWFNLIVTLVMLPIVVSFMVLFAGLETGTELPPLFNAMLNDPVAWYTSYAAVCALLLVLLYLYSRWVCVFNRQTQKMVLSKRFGLSRQVIPFLEIENVSVDSVEHIASQGEGETTYYYTYRLVAQLKSGSNLHLSRGSFNKRENAYQVAQRVRQVMQLKDYVAPNAAGEKQVARHKGTVTALAVSRDGRYVASGDSKYTVILKNTSPGGKTHKLRGHSYIVTCVAFSADGQTLASGSKNMLRLWDVSTGQRKRQLEYGRKSDQYTRLISDQQAVREMSFQERMQTANKMMRQTFQDVERAIQAYVISVTFSPDARWLAVGWDNGMIHIWAVSKGTEKSIAPVLELTGGHEKGNVVALAYSTRGLLLASSSSEGTVCLWDSRRGELLHTLTNGQTVRQILFSRDDERLTTVTHSGQVRSWHVAHGVQVSSHLVNIHSQSGSVAGVALSPDGDTLASGTSQGAVALWRVQTGERLAVLDGHRAPVRTLTFSPDGRTLVTGADDCTVRTWQISAWVR